MNEESLTLQTFISTVSHDLRAPIRHLSQFSTLLANSLGELTEEQLEYLGFIQSSSEKCNLMLDGLSLLSQIHSREKKPSLIDFGILNQALIEELAVRYECQPDVVINSEIKIFNFDMWHCQLLLEVLLDNAFKFRDPDKVLKINVDLSQKEDTQTLVISDNGVGIMDSFLPYCTKIFNQQNGDNKGVGTGLTLAEHITSANQGLLTVTSEMDSASGGTSVNITFPCQPA